MFAVFGCLFMYALLLSLDVIARHLEYINLTQVGHRCSQDIDPSWECLYRLNKIVDRHALPVR